MANRLILSDAEVPDQFGRATLEVSLAPNS